MIVTLSEKKIQKIWILNQGFAINIAVVVRSTFSPKICNNEPILRFSRLMLQQQQSTRFIVCLDFWRDKRTTNLCMMLNRTIRYFSVKYHFVRNVNFRFIAVHVISIIIVSHLLWVYSAAVPSVKIRSAFPILSPNFALWKCTGTIFIENCGLSVLFNCFEKIPSRHTSLPVPKTFVKDERTRVCLTFLPSTND